LTDNRLWAGEWNGREGNLGDARKTGSQPNRDWQHQIWPDDSSSGESWKGGCAREKRGNGRKNPAMQAKNGLEKKRGEKAIGETQLERGAKAKRLKISIRA